SRAGREPAQFGVRLRCQLTENVRPSALASPGSAPTPSPSGSPRPKNRPVLPLEMSSIALDVQLASVSVPGCALPIAALFATVPKLVSGTGRQRPDVEQSDGASAIHSADAVSSSWAGVITLEKRVCRVRSFSENVSFGPFTSTAALIVSPAFTTSGIRTDAAG